MEELVKGLKTGNEEIVAGFLMKYPTIDMNLPVHEEMRPLEIAAGILDEAHIEVARLLIHAKAGVNDRDQNGVPPICAAAASDSKHANGFIKVLLEEKANVDLSSTARGNTPLHLASMTSDEQRVKMLLDAKANIAQLDAEGFNCIQLLASRQTSTTTAEGDAKIATLLMDSKADIYMRPVIRDLKNQVSIESLTKELLLRYMDSLEMAYFSRNRTVEEAVRLRRRKELKKTGSFFEKITRAVNGKKPRNSATPANLFIAAGMGDLEAIKKICKLDQVTAAAAGERRVLLNCYKNYSPLLCAVEYGQIDAIDLLLDAKADVNVLGGDIAKTCARSNRLQMLKVLHSTGLQIGVIQAEQRQKPKHQRITTVGLKKWFHETLGKGHDKKESNSNNGDKKEEVAMSITDEETTVEVIEEFIKHGNDDAVEFLLKKKADIAAVTDAFFKCKSNNADILKLLLSNKADISLAADGTPIGRKDKYKVTRKKEIRSDEKLKKKKGKDSCSRFCTSGACSVM